MLVLMPWVYFRRISSYLLVYKPCKGSRCASGATRFVTVLRLLFVLSARPAVHFGNHELTRTKKIQRLPYQCCRGYIRGRSFVSRTLVTRMYGVVGADFEWCGYGFSGLRVRISSVAGTAVAHFYTFFLEAASVEYFQHSSRSCGGRCLSSTFVSGCVFDRYACTTGERVR